VVEQQLADLPDQGDADLDARLERRLPDHRRRRDLQRRQWRRHLLPAQLRDRGQRLRRQDLVLRRRVGQSPVRRDGEADARRQRAQTFRAEYKTGTASVLAWVGDARILALRLDKFDNSYFASNYNVQATTSAGYQEFLTLTQTPQAVDHAIIAIGAYNPVSTTVSGYAQALQGATSLSEVVKESQNTAGYQYLGMVSKQTLAATSTHGSGKPGPRPRAPQSTPTSSPSPFYSLAPHPRQALAAATWRSRAEPSSWGSIVSPEQQSATIIALHDAVNKIEATLNDGMKAMIAEHRVELKQIKGEVETIRTTVTSHVAKEDVLSRSFRRRSASASPSAARCWRPCSPSSAGC
jgi:hypothetical protein